MRRGARTILLLAVWVAVGAATTIASFVVESNELSIYVYQKKVAETDDLRRNG